MDDAAFERLCERVFDGRATELELRDLEEQVLSQPSRRRQYARWAELHGLLHLLGPESITPMVAPSPAPPPRRRTVAILVCGLAALTLMIAWLWNRPAPTHADTFAQITAAERCLWREAPIVVEVGQRLGPGHFKLAQGLLVVNFDLGCRVDFEGPVEFDVLGPRLCRLSTGKAVVTMSPGNKGFTVETPHGRMIDQGTSFGVTVNAEGEALVQVFDGAVDVEHNATGAKRRLTQSKSARLLTENLQEGGRPKPLPSHRHRIFQVTTAHGAGQDWWIQRDDAIRSGPDDLLLVKTEVPHFQGYDRRIFLRFDLSEPAMRGAVKASLQLMATPSDLGFISRSPETTVAAYGFNDDAVNDWQAGALNWSNAPGITDDDANLQPAVLLGRFTIPRGQQNGVFEITTPELLHYLQARVGKLATIVIVSETIPLQSGSAVYSFASSRHETLPPPSLRLWIDE